MSVPFRISKRPAGDYAIQRFERGQIVRWGIYPTRRQAEAHLPIANVSHRPVTDVVRALSERSPA